MSAGMDSRGPILLLGCVPFRSLRQRPQQLALALSLRTAVVYLDPPRSALGRLAAPDLSVEQAPTIGGALEVIDAPGAMPGSGYVPVVNRFNYSRVATLVRGRLARRGFESPRAIVAQFPKHYDLLRAFPEAVVVYDVMDDYPLFFDPWQRAVLAGLHRKLLQRADVVTVTSSKLEELCRPHARRLARVPNGVDAAFFDACADAQPDPFVLSLPAPRIGFVGALERWVDFDVLRGLAAAFPVGSVVLVGPAARMVPKLPSNVHLLGERPHGTLPGMLRAFDMGIVPFVRSPLTDAVNAVKIYEYLSAGLPVLSANLQGAADFGELVRLCATLPDWIDAARQVGAATSKGEWARRREFALQNLWSSRADALMGLLEEAETARG